MQPKWSRKRRPPSERFWEKVNKNGPIPNHAPNLGNCWIWTASLNKGGYGQFGTGEGRDITRAYHWSWEQEHGSRDRSLQLDHLCRVRACVRPSHLEPVTQRENLMRGETLPAINSAKTHCPRGHEYAGSNLYLDPKTGHRHCRICFKLNQRIDPDNPRVVYMSDATKASIRSLYAAGGVTQAQIAAQLGLSRISVSRVLRGRR